MAKKRRQKIEKKDDYVFKPTEMDKNAFIRRELRNAKTMFLAFGLAIVMGFVSFGLMMALGDFRVGAVIGIFAVATLPFMFNTFKIDMVDYEKKNWLGAGAIYLFTWLMVVIIMSNPPIADIASPEIFEPSIETWNPEIVENKTVGWEAAQRTSDGEVTVNVNESFRIVVEIFDNRAVDGDTVRCDLISPGSVVIALTTNELGDNEFTFEHTFTDPNSEKGVYEFRIRASDSSDNDVEDTGSFILK